MPSKEEEKDDTKKMQLRQRAATLLAQANVERQRQLAATQRSPFLGNSTAKNIVPNKLPFGYDPATPVEKDRLSKLKKEFIGILSVFRALSPNYIEPDLFD